MEIVIFVLEILLKRVLLPLSLVYYYDYFTGIADWVPVPVVPLNKPKIQDPGCEILKESSPGKSSSSPISFKYMSSFL